MEQGFGIFLLLAFAFVVANLPFLFERVLFVLPPPGGRKGFGWRLLELVVLYLIVGTVALVLEARAHGGSYPQGWQFYATTFCLFVVFAFPGFVYRHLLRRRSDVVRVA
ncbi:MAG: DUF2818 family protein [Rhodocyclaceae bacterium]|jgi:hypothetical protein|nr:DUF2818 family protein [Rhodocyclaceae bacterium]